MDRPDPRRGEGTHGLKTALTGLPPSRPACPEPERRRVRQARLAAAGVICAGLGAIGLAALIAHAIDRRTAAGSVEGQPAMPAGSVGNWDPAATVVAAGRLNRAAGVLALSVLADSALEHYRGSFGNRAMLIPPAVSALTIAISMHGLVDRRPAVHSLRHAIYIVAGLTGLVGTAFHVYNIGKRPGGFSWLNLFYSAPLGAPGAIALAGLLGWCGERVRGIPPGGAKLFGLPAGRTLALLTSGGLLGTTGEVWLLHFRGAFHDPAMLLPVSLPPATALLLAGAAVGSKGVDRYLTRWALRATALTGVAGVGFHAYGVSRNMGGWRNWSQNILNGPPLPAPPSFTGLALAGLAALGLMGDHPDA